MERFGLTRLDLMRMTWSQVIMLFDSTHTDGGGGGKASDVRDATLRDYDKWA